MKKRFAVIILLILIIGLFVIKNLKNESSLKLYWFIPDGVPADPDVFTVFKWAEEGKLPNLKKLIENGTYGYSKPTFPSHTPTNFATLLTGTYPDIHGVNDGPMHVIGKPLDKVAIPGFRSVAKKISPIWKTLEENNLKVLLLSIPGSTPPEINKGEVFRGRWGGWGADYNAIVFESKGDLSQRIKQGRAARLFYFGPQLTQYIDNNEPKNWVNPPISYSKPIEIQLTSYGATIYGYVYDSTDDKKINYNKTLFSLDKKNTIADLKQGDWSKWEPIILKWTAENKTLDVNSDVIINPIIIREDGFVRIRINYNNLNQYISQPGDAAERLLKSTGPMLDFVDNFPSQLGYYPEDKKTFIEEMNMSFDWHRKAVSAIVDNFSPNVVIHDVYSPTVMLCSKWWTGYIDPISLRYNDVSEAERENLWNEVKDMYVKLDNILGEIIKKSGKNTYIVFSSDHGVIPQSRNVYLNNLFAQKGWLKFTIDSKTGEPIIDWKNSQVIYLKMAHVYINPKGLAGNYERGTGEAYERLRTEVIQALQDLEDGKGVRPVEKIVKWENVKTELHLTPERAGDLVIANKPNYGWSEEMSNDLKLFGDSMASGYKQALDPNYKELWTPFVIMGPGIKKNNYLGNQPINHVDQYPTIFKTLKLQVPNFVQGKSLPIFEGWFRQLIDWII